MRNSNGLPTRENKSTRHRSLYRVPWWFTVPALTIYLVIFIWPSLDGARVSLTDWTLTSPTRHYIGLENFRTLLHDEVAIRSVKNTVIISIATVVLSNVGGVLIATWVSTRLRVSALARTLFFIPMLLTPLVTSYMWGFILAPSGALNSTLRSIGLDSFTRPWLAEPKWGLFWCIVVIAWMSLGASMVLYLAGLEGISVEVIEAARVDGANALQVLRHIRLPLLRPAAAISLTLSVIFSLKVFDQVLALTGGGPANMTDTLATLIFKQAFELSKMGYATALGMVLTALIVLISFPLQARLRRGAEL